MQKEVLGKYSVFTRKAQTLLSLLPLEKQINQILATLEEGEGQLAKGKQQTTEEHEKECRKG